MSEQESSSSAASSSSSTTAQQIDPELDANRVINTVENDSMQLHQFEKQFVTQVYNEIAPHFSNTRYSRWPFINEYILGKENCLFADIGCGNGKYMQSWKETLEFNRGNKLSKISTSNCFIGTDISDGLAEICKGRDLEVMVADNTRLPFKSEKFDVVISVAVIHHFATPERRMNAIRELFRVCKQGGEVLIYVWAFEQQSKKKSQDSSTPSYRYPQQDVFVPWHLQKQFDKKPAQNAENFIQGEDGEKVYKRFYHLFKEGELEKLVEEASFTTCPQTGEKVQSFDFEFVKNMYYEKDNWGVVCRKK